VCGYNASVLSSPEKLIRLRNVVHQCEPRTATVGGNRSEVTRSNHWATSPHFLLMTPSGPDSIQLLHLYYVCHCHKLVPVGLYKNEFPLAIVLNAYLSAVSCLYRCREERLPAACLRYIIARYWRFVCATITWT